MDILTFDSLKVELNLVILKRFQLSHQKLQLNDCNFHYSSKIIEERYFVRIPKVMLLRLLVVYNSTAACATAHVLQPVIPCEDTLT